ncbi:hypothetical protein [Streptomyces niphimycinicus]|nr:hypothetical protein [Streptomyces niphimycinicus]
MSQPTRSLDKSLGSWRPKLNAADRHEGIGKTAWFELKPIVVN